jgi:Cof subfamily protein (haloacid dehalogenase superfamily)
VGGNEIMITDKSLEKLKLIVFDLDGTLLNDDGEIGEESKRLVAELKKKNILFTFASGRLHTAFVDYARELDLKIPLISLDGTLIKSFPDGNTIFQSYIPVSDMKKVIAYADKYLFKLALCHADAIYYDDHNSIVPSILNKFGAKFEEVPYYGPYLENTLEVVMMSDYKESIVEVNNRLNFPYTWGLTTNYYRSQSHNQMYFLEVRKKGASKGTGLKHLLKKLKIKWNETAVLGDWHNDKSLFETKALKIAVANAVAEIKFKSDHVTQRTNHEDGVAEFLEMVLKAKTLSK